MSCCPKRLPFSSLKGTVKKIATLEFNEGLNTVSIVLSKTIFSNSPKSKPSAVIKSPGKPVFNSIELSVV